MMNPTRYEDASPSYVNNYLSEERPKRYSSIDLKSFTSDFSDSNSIGSGGYAEVYKGLFPGGELRAVKLLNKMNSVEDTFMTEVRTMGNTAHRNLVKLYGYCFEDNMKALVYEYMENGSLNKILYEGHHGHIEWSKLYDIVIDIANGLKYLHHELDEHIIHHDIKAANVLLDKNLSAKIADFGLARIMKRDVSGVDLSGTRGTPGYNALETWMPGSKVTFKCDVFSYGLMLFEVLGKRKNGEAENWFPGLVWSQFENRNLEHYITTDCGIVEKDKENAKILCKVAFWCVQDDPDQRPTMKDVVLMLEKKMQVEDPPYPSFYFRQASSPMVDVEESRRENNEREWSDKMELDHTYPQNIITGPSNALVEGSDNRVTLPQLKRRKTRSPNSTKHLNYHRGLDENLNKLEEKMAQLNDLKSDINHRVIDEETLLKVRTNQVNGWMQRVEAKKHKVDQILLEGRQHLERCLSVNCPENCRSGYKLDKKVGNILILVEELKCDGVFENVTQNQHCAQFQELPENFTVGLDHVFERVVELLGRNDIQVLGLYGVGGVGKTTLLNKINNELPTMNNSFDIVIWVVISSEVNMRIVQEAFRKRLGLKSWEESVPLTSRANDIYTALKKKTFLILLDDIWEEIDLQSIGIPRPSALNKSKIVLTTRSSDVCGSMGARHKVEVNCLNKNLSWNLFEEKVGPETLAADPLIPELARKVAEKCHGLPLALITVGASMASKTNPREWQSAISDFNKCAAKFPGMEDRVLHLLKFSYDRLPNDTEKVCFLFCALYPEDYPIFIDDLIEKWIGLGYISGFEDYEEAVNRGHGIIGTLRRTSLLEKGWNDKHVKMHDIIRELALWIAREDGREEGKVFVKSGKTFTELPITDFRPAIVQTISLIDTIMGHLECLPSCPNLSTFFALREKNRYVGKNLSMPDDFFLSMPALKILDLSGNYKTKVPTSICELVELEYLDLTDTDITSLPYKMRNLTKLKYLSAGSERIRYIEINKCIIPCGVIENLSNLEILKLINQEGVDIDELGCLKKLKALEINLSDFEDIEKFVSNPFLCNCARRLIFEECIEITFLTLSASPPPPPPSSSSLSSYLCLGHFRQLRKLEIRDSSEIKEWMFTNESEICLYESLEEMELFLLPELVISWDASKLHSGAHFRKLHYVGLTGCDAMVDLTWLLLIPNLKVLVVEECGGLEEILSSSGDESGGVQYDQNTFSNLNYLNLEYLPNLRSICSIALHFPLLETIGVMDCPELRRLPLDSNSASNTLKEIEGPEEWWNELQWDNEAIKTHFTTKFIARDF